MRVPPEGRAGRPLGSARLLWVFDLDDTLHDAGAAVFPFLHRQISAYLEERLGLTPAEADALRQRYWQHYGATLGGLIRHHGVDPHDFLHRTHPLPPLAGLVTRQARLPRALACLPGRKVVFSNAPVHYVRELLRLLRVAHLFDGIFAIEHGGFRPKPAAAGYRRLLHRLRVPAHRCVMVEDALENLKTARRLGMRTVWVRDVAARPAGVDVRVRSVLALPRQAARWTGDGRPPGGWL